MDIDILQSSVKSGFRAALKTAWWMARLTVLISFGVMLMQYFGIVEQISRWLTPAFTYLGLSGEAALVFISGALVNIYAAIAVVETIGLDTRSITILALMCLCAHNLILETAIQRKTGSSALQMVAIRLATALLSAIVLNAVLPPTAGDAVLRKIALREDDFAVVLTHWAIGTLGLVCKMCAIIISLTVLQRVLAELGAIRWLSLRLRLLMHAFGLPQKTAFLWIVSQTLGLAYGGAVMFEEKAAGKLTRRELDLLNYHIAVSHSNVEDVLLFFFAGASLWWMYSLRVVLAVGVVWGRRLLGRYNF
ncbi:MAG: nucleoside recognition protein [Prevotellaceae bacterium]|nr:nucleoside recognition protein [Prevotellaceae bacterium]